MRTVANIGFRVLLVMVLSSTPVHPTFDNQSGGARAPGMANTFVAVADDANAILYNPAGLTQLPAPELTTQYGQLLKGLEDGSRVGSSYFGYGHPLKEGALGTLGFGYHQFNAANLVNERTFLLSYGTPLRLRSLSGTDGVWATGVSLKRMVRDFEPDRFTENGLNDSGTASGQKDPLFAKHGFTQNAMALDVSGLYRFGPGYRYSAGITVTNINQPDISLGGDGDHIPMTTKIGLARRYSLGVLSAEVRRRRRLKDNADLDLALGGEHRFRFQNFGALEVRGGYAEGGRGYKDLTAGLSYIFSRISIDYAMGFPIGGLSDTNSSHRIGFSIKMDPPKNVSAADSATHKESAYDLIRTFESDARASLGLVKRQTLANLDRKEESLLLQYLLRKYSLDDPGTDDIRRALASAIQNKETDILAWTEIRTAIIRKVPPEDKSTVLNGLESSLKGDTRRALSWWVLLSEESRSQSLIRGLLLIAHAELAAQAYRATNLETCIDQTGRMIDLLPSDHELKKAYRRLLLERMNGFKESFQALQQNPDPKNTASFPTRPPEAPQVLVAPKSVQRETSAELTSYEVMVQNYGIALDYYLSRKSNGAQDDERRHLLEQMKAVYGRYSIDLSLVEKELSAMEKAAIPSAVEQKEHAPTKTPTPKPMKPKATSTPAAPSADPEFIRSWAYYLRAVEEGITNREKIQLLESLLNRFGAEGTETAQRELAALRKQEFGK